MNTKHIDPEYRRWKNKFPTFPGVRKCVDLLLSKNVKGAWIDFICIELEQYSKNEPSELINILENIEDDRVRKILLGVIENIAVPESVPLLSDLLRSEKEYERQYAISSLKKVGNKAARKALFHAGGMHNKTQNKRKKGNSTADSAALKTPIKRSVMQSTK